MNSNQQHSLPPHPLYVDLDGTLISSDLLYESTLKLAKQDFLSLLRIPLWLRKGKAALKEEIAKRVDLDASQLPYHEKVLELIRSRKDAGGKVYLATASHKRYAAAVCDHLKIFDGFLATSESSNLRGSEKLKAIQAQDQTFDYIGNGSEDLVLWEAAATQIAVEPSSKTFRALPKGTEILKSRSSQLRPLIKALRPHQWLKNLLIFVPLLAAHQFTSVNTIFSGLLAFLAFSSCASGVYLLNDMLDLESDRTHPTKRLRPFAAGTLSIPTGIVAFFLCWTIGIGTAFLLPWQFVLTLGFYLLVTNAYSFRLKRVIMLDVAILAGLYTIRIIAGAAAVTVPLSFWLLAFSMFVFLSLALVKRYSEIYNMKQRGLSETSGRGYRSVDEFVIGQLGTSSGIVSILVLALYVNSAEVQELYNNHVLIWLLCPLFLYWIGRLWLLASRGKVEEDPVVFAAKDRRTWLVGAAAGAVVLLAL